MAARTLLYIAGMILTPRFTGPGIDGPPGSPVPVTPEEAYLNSYGFSRQEHVREVEAARKLKEIHGNDVVRRLADMVLLDSWGILVR
jgi:hypothetical protein